MYAEQDELACVSHFLANMESKMLLKKFVEIIELTDSDHLSRQLELFNEHGFVDAESCLYECSVGNRAGSACEEVVANWF